MVEAFLEKATAATSFFLTEKVDACPAISHAQGSSDGYEEAKDAIARDLKHVFQSYGHQETTVTYSVHYSDVNGLSRLENYILALEIADYLSK